MICRACNQHASSVKSIYDDGEIIDVGCDRCSGVQAAVPDVYWPGHTYKSEALGVEFTSRGQKAQYLKDNNLTEAGDMKMGQKSWQEGSKDYRRKQFDKDRPRIREIYRQWREKSRA